MLGLTVHLSDIVGKVTLMNALSPIEHVQAALEQLEGINNPKEKAKETTDFLNFLKSANEEASLVRQAACISLVQQGWTYQAIGELIGVGKARANQILTGWRTPRRPGVIEQRVATALAEQRALGATDEQVVEQIVPMMRHIKGADQLSAKAIADLLQVRTSLVTPVLKKVDRQIEKTKAEKDALASVKR